MIEKKERFKVENPVKDWGMRQVANGLVLLFAVTLNVLLDYVSVGFDPAVYQSTAYWLQLVTSNAAVVIILFSSRGFAKEKELSGNVEILRIQSEIDLVHAELNRHNLSTAFEEYVNAINRERKLTVYRNRLNLKADKCRDTKHGRKKRERLLGLLERAEAEIEFRRVRYDRVRIATIFSRTRIRNDDDMNLECREGREVGSLLVNKFLNILGFGILGASMTFDTMAFSTVALLKTVIKLFQCAYAWYAGSSSGSTFVRGTMLSKMLRRLDFVQQFLEKRKAVTEG